MYFFEKVWAKSVDFLVFTRKLAKILKFYSKFWRITLKNVNMLLKKLIFTKLWASLVVKKRFLV